MKNLIVVIPCYNEEESLPYTVTAILAVLKKLPPAYHADILFVNDGSSDNTQEVLKDLSKQHPNVYYRQFSANAGHQSALRAGLDSAVGYDAAIMMDADLQHPPELIPDMIEAWSQGPAIVQMIRQDSAKDTGFSKYITSRLYYTFINWLTNLNLEYGASDFRLIDRSIIDVLAASKERDLFLRGYFSWLPASRTTIIYTPNKRVAGTSKYTLRKLLELAYKSVIQFSEKPLRIAVSIGVVVAALSFVYGIVLILLRLFGNHTVSGWTSLMAVVLFCFGVNFILLGFIGSYIAHAITIQKRRPEFIIASEKLPS